MPDLIARDQVEGGALAPKSAAATDAMEVRLESGVPPIPLSRHVVVDDQCDLAAGSKS